MTKAKIRHLRRILIGAKVAAAMHMLQTSYKGKTAVVLICDSGLQYLSTDLWE